MLPFKQKPRTDFCLLDRGSLQATRTCSVSLFWWKLIYQLVMNLAVLQFYDGGGLLSARIQVEIASLTRKDVFLDDML